ncbi:MAG: hypothetical protein ACXADS_10475 [Candidatus Thorarchaeota archaeon]|jgi:hypothetical protein
MSVIKANDDETPLPFAHGIEVELQVIKRNGSWIRGEEILDIFDKLVSNAKAFLDNKIRTSRVDSVKRKYRQSTQTEEGERGSRIVASYDGPDGRTGEYTLIGHDPNVTSLTWILEVATPPCTSIEELAWWTQTLVAISYDSLPKDARAILISTGLNPTQEYLRNLSFGEHHHILSPGVREEVKIAVYNMIRNFIPHLIAISVNSPFENKKPTDDVSVGDDDVTRTPRCRRSIRLLKNTTQLGPTNEFEFIPYLRSSDKEGFARHVNRGNARMVDLYPFTDYGTIELRVIDTQLSVPRRVGIALILQALALKAKRMIEAGEQIPDPGAKVLAANRSSAVSAGLWGPFRPMDETGTEFAQIYNHLIKDDGTIDKTRRNRFVGDAVASMFYLIRNELEELDIVDNPFMQPIMVSVFGSELSRPRTTGADLQLDVYAKSGMNMVALMKSLADITRECCTNWLFDPLEGTPHLPTWLCWWKGLEPEIVAVVDRVFAGQEAEFVLTLRNSSPRSLDNLTVSCTIEDTDRNVSEQSIVSISSIDRGQIHVERIVFQTRKDVTAYNIIVAIGLGGKQINLSSTINTYWMRVQVRPGTTTQFADGQTPVLFSGSIETNYPETKVVSCSVAVVSLSKESVLAETQQSLRIEGGEIVLFEDSDLPRLVVPAAAFQGVERCALRIGLDDEQGNEVASSISRPFYVGFVKKEPQLVLDADLRSVYNPGDLIMGEVELFSQGREFGDAAELRVEFLADSGTTREISRIGISEVVGKSARFTWRVPQLDADDLESRSGLIRASVLEHDDRITSVESSRFQIDHLEVMLNVDSLRSPDSSHIGGKISGWLRVRRNTEYGDPGTLTMSLVFPNGEEQVVVTQSVKQGRNLSLAYGPIIVPKPKSMKDPASVTLVAKLSYNGTVLDQRSAEIALMRGPEAEIARIAFAGVPAFVVPDEAISPTVQVTNTTGKTLDYELSVEIQSIGGSETLLTRQVKLSPEEAKMFPIPFRVPLGAEMSTAHLRAIVRHSDLTTEKKDRLRVKAIENPLFSVDFSIHRETGEDVPGLVARLTPVEINAQITSPRDGMEDLSIVLRVMSRREVIKQFQRPFPDSSAESNEVKIRWITPAVDIVTGYYLEAVILQAERALPDRAVSQDRKQFTVY